VEEVIQPVTEMTVERAMRPVAQMTPQMESSTMTTTSRLESTTVTTATSTTMHAPTVVPVEPMPAAIPGLPSPYNAVDFCVPVGPDFSLVNGRCFSRQVSK